VPGGHVSNAKAEQADVVQQQRGGHLSGAREPGLDASVGAAV